MDTKLNAKQETIAHIEELNKEIARIRGNDQVFSRYLTLMQAKSDALIALSQFYQ